MILIIHPMDKSTNCLSRISNYIEHRIDNVHVFRVHPNNQSKSACLERIQSCSKDDLIIFMGHGSSTALFGSKGRFYDSSSLISDDALNENPEYGYYDKYFISRDNWEVLIDKQIICISCFSADFGKLLDKSISISSFLGFGNLPSSRSEFNEMLIPANANFIGLLKGEYNYILKNALLHGFRNNYSIHQISELIKFTIQKRIVHWNKSSFRHKKLLVEQLYLVKNSIICIL